MPIPLLTTTIDRLARRHDLTAGEAAEVLVAITDGGASEAEIAAVLIALRTKGESVDELFGFAAAMRRRAVPVVTSPEGLLDTAGTGGGPSTFNVSTTAALIAAAAGSRVAKHGNRSSTGRSGSADVLEALGVRIDLPVSGVAECISRIGFGFMFAPAHHASMERVVRVRKALAVRTIFNLIGPLTNPAGATRQLIGVSDPAYLRVIAGALARLGTERALVVAGAGGLDELSTSGTTRVVEVDPTGTCVYDLVPEDVGLPRAPISAFAGGTPAQNAEATRRVLAGERGPCRDVAVLNAGAAIYVSGGAPSLMTGVRCAEAAVDSGRAQATLDALVAATTTESLGRRAA